MQDTEPENWGAELTATPGGRKGSSTGQQVPAGGPAWPWPPHCGSCYFWRRQAPRRRKHCPRGHTQCALTHIAAAPAWRLATRPLATGAPPSLRLGTPLTIVPRDSGWGRSGPMCQHAAAPVTRAPCWSLCWDIPRAPCPSVCPLCGPLHEPGDTDPPCPAPSPSSLPLASPAAWLGHACAAAGGSAR